MATKDERPGLLSKVAMFVRNPTKDWSELDKEEPPDESGYDKQTLKAMIERKRQNDFVRKREFDQLRKLRRKDPAALAGLQRPSMFQSSSISTDPEGAGRAVTLKKIDEIEAQMSKQWWKGKQEAAQGAGFPVAQATSVEHGNTEAATLAPAQSAQSFAPTEAASIGPTPDGAEFAATQMGGEMQGSPSGRPRAAMQPMPDTGGADVRFSTSQLFAIEENGMETDPELEEAAIRFANGDDAGAESSLLTALRADAIAPVSAMSWASALLDLYRATNNRAKFDAARAEFGARLSAPPSAWSAISGSVALPASRPAVAKSGSSTAIWSAPAKLTLQAMESLRDAMSSTAPPWHLSWAALTYIEAEAMPLMGGLFASLCAEPVALRFSGANRLVMAMRSATPSGDKSTDTSWWDIRLNVLRALRLQDEFELAALDYCVTFEVAPPAWEDARCEYSDYESSGAEETESTAPMALDGSVEETIELSGEVLGDANTAMAELDGARHKGDAIVVACHALVRVDFSAAGSILNWVAMRQAEGTRVQFRDAHRLVAAFFNVIGINEHATVHLRAL